MSTSATIHAHQQGSHNPLNTIDTRLSLECARGKIADDCFYEIYEDSYQDLLDNMVLDINEWEKLCNQCHGDQKFGTFAHAKVDLQNKVDNFYKYLDLSCNLKKMNPILTIQKEIDTMLVNSGSAIIRKHKNELESAQNQLQTVQGEFQNKKTENDNLQQEINQKNETIAAKTNEFEALRTQCETNKQKYKENKKSIITKRIELANLKYDADTLKAELEFTNDEKEKYEDKYDEPLCSRLSVFFDGFHQKHISTLRLTLYTLIILLGAITVSSVFTCVHPFNENVEYKYLILFWFLPFISAFISCLYFVFAKRFFDNDSYDTIFFMRDRRILISILNLAFIVMSVVYYFYNSTMIACLFIRALQGLIVGFLSIIYPISLFQLGKTKQPLYLFSFFLVFLTFGVLFCVPLQQKWPLYIIIFPGLQTILIWFIKKSSFNFVNLKVEFRVDFKFHLEILVMILHILQPFLGPFTLWTVISRNYSDRLDNVKFILPFVVGSFVFCIFLIILRLKNDNTFALASILVSIPSLVFAFIGSILIIFHKDYYGLILMSFCNGIGLFHLPWLPYYETKTRFRPKTFGFYWGLYWLSTSLSSVLFTKISLYYLSFVWLSIIVLIVAISSLYFTFVKNDTCHTIL